MTPSPKTASRQQLEADNRQHRASLGLHQRDGAFAETLSAMTDVELHTENLRLSEQLQTSAKAGGDTHDPKPKRAATAEPPKTGGLVMVADETSWHEKETLAKPLNLSERCRIANGEREEDVRRDRLQKNHVAVVPAPGSLTARAIAQKGGDASKPWVLGRV